MIAQRSEHEICHCRVLLIVGNFFINRVAENILLEKKEKEGKRREKRGSKRGRKREKGGGRVGRGVEKEVE